MKLVRVGAAVLNQTPLDWERNAANIKRAIELGLKEGVSVLCLPELCISGYGCEDAFYSASMHQTSMDVLSEILPECDGITVCIGLPVFFRRAIYNCVAVVSNKELLGFVAKQNLAGEGLHYEPRWFTPWPSGVSEKIEVRHGHEVPIGDLIFDIGGLRMGCEICEDAWVADRSGRTLAQRGVDLILNPSASHFAFDKYEVRKRFVQEGSRAFGVSYVYTNLVGNEAGRIIYDGGVLIASCGDLLIQGPRFVFEDVHLTSAVIDLHKGRVKGSSGKAARKNARLKEGREGEVSCRFAFPQLNPESRVADVRTWELSKHIRFEEFSRAIALGLFDYLRKSKSRGFVVSLSGGADSSAVAVLVRLMVEFAVAELGEEVAREKFFSLPKRSLDENPSHKSLEHYVPTIEPEACIRGIVQELLLCVYQATRNSSDTTYQAAKHVAQAVGAAFLRFEIDELVDHYISLAEQGIGRKTTWLSDDIALQNIQARVRAPSVWMLANLRCSLLLATSNRSEAAVGYTTMDGDTCGSISPIAGIDKAFLRDWLDWMETIAPEGINPIPELSRVNEQEPTAELRPAREHQSDEQDLMPYPLLDAIERSAIRDRLSPVEVFKFMRAEFNEYSAPQLAVWVEKFFTLWCRNQWKRERYAPSFHVDDKNLDPKTWCRFPILSGGFRRELLELKKIAHIM